MSSDEVTKNNLIDEYIRLLRIKADKEGKELELQLELAKIKLSFYDVDASSIEKMLFEDQ